VSGTVSVSASASASESAGSLKWLPDNLDDVFKNMLWGSHNPANVWLSQDDADDVIPYVWDGFGESVAHPVASVTNKLQLS
jgi:hypothetical protein